MGMGKGGSNPTHTTQEVTQEVPQWAKPFYTDLLEKAKASSEEGYIHYPGQRLAADSPDLTKSQNMIRAMSRQGIRGFEPARAAFRGLGKEARQFGVPQLSDFSRFRGFKEFDFGPARQFNQREVDRYMSPYMDTVVSRQQDDAREQFRRGQGERDARFVTAGAFGGSRQAIQQGLAEQDLSRQLGDIMATGQQRAFEQAQQQFERDRGFQFDHGRAQAGEAARVQAGRAAELARVQQARADDLARQREMQLQAMGFRADMAKQLAQLGERQRDRRLQTAQLMEAQGLSAMGREQAGLDMAFQDFLRQRQFPRDQLAFYSSILRGLPVNNTGQTTTAEPQASPMQQALGAGIGALGLWQGLSS